MEKAQEAINGTADSLDGVSATARKLGLNRQMVEDIYRKYGSTMQGRAVCGLLGTTPEALKADAERMLGGGSAPFQPPPERPAGHKQIPPAEIAVGINSIQKE